jgi:hypothetical protein
MRRPTSRRTSIGIAADAKRKDLEKFGARLVH